MKKYFIILPFLICSKFIFGQVAVSVGLRAGINFASVETTPKISSSNYFSASQTGILGIHIAVPIELRLSDYFALQPELAFSQKGYNLSVIDNNSRSSKYEATLNYLELPLLAKIYIGDAPTKFNFLIGPSLGFLMGGKSIYTGSVNGSFFDQKVETEINPSDSQYRSLNTIDFGVNVGAGLSFPTGHGRFFMESRYQFGFSDRIADNPDVYKSFHRVFGVNIGYLHALGDE